MGGDGAQAKGRDLTAKSISSVGGLIKYLCSEVGTIDLFGRENGAKTKHCYLTLSFLALLVLWEWCICGSHTMFSGNEKSSCLLKSSLRNS